MGFRSVEPEPREPQPAVPTRWVAIGTFALIVLPFLPVFFGLILGVLSVLMERLDDAPVRVPIREFHHSDLDTKKRVYPESPDEAKPLNLPPQRCLAVVSMNDEGTPYDVSVSNCPDVFVLPTQEALLKWRWMPPKKDGHPAAARTTIAVTYKMDDDPPATPPVREWAEARKAQNDEAETRLDLDLPEN